MHPLLQCMLTRRSIRSYTDKQISHENLLTLLEAARFAPSGSSKQSWHFTALQAPKTLTELQEAVHAEALSIVIDEATPKPKKNLHARAKTENFSLAFGAPTLILVSNERSYQNGMADCACAMQNIMLMAHALDLGSCWINACHWLTDAPKVRAVYTKLGIPEAHIVCGSIAVGYPASALPEAPARKDNTITII